ncbi:hypothetical protein EVAR_27058_1 [Eumeta japonica]|uniref:Uncharacterized protein n=1 Tax=Eumeta variegata TaxID=151549 RepID=A0A4C1WD82_EUMVA|nr:hypothetical protein EVAR_27058_1 [Eumeta japonica]
MNGGSPNSRGSPAPATKPRKRQNGAPPAGISQDYVFNMAYKHGTVVLGEMLEFLCASMLTLFVGTIHCAKNMAWLPRSQFGMGALPLMSVYYF